MKKQQQKKAGVKEKARKLTVNKQTIKDLDPKTDNPKGGAVAEKSLVLCKTEVCY